MSHEPDGPSAEEIAHALSRLDLRIENLRSRYETPRAMLLPVLHLLQKEFRRLSPAVLAAAAKRLDLRPAEVFHVAEFYSLLRTRLTGRHVLRVCRSLPCEMAGARRLVETLSDKLGVRPGETTTDRHFTLEETECLGWCHKAPVMQVGDGDYLEAMTPEDVRELLVKLEQPHRG